MAPFFKRMTEHPLPVIFAAYYMYWMSVMMNWVMGMNPEDAKHVEWIVAAVVAGAVGYFKFYTDLIMGKKDE